MKIILSTMITLLTVVLVSCSGGGASDSNQAMENELQAALDDAVVAYGGKGLADITYTHAGKSSKRLRKAELMHLKAVANLVNHFYWIGTASIIISIILFVLIRQINPPLPKFKQVMAGILLLALMVTATFTIFGPRKVFQWLHTQMFPKSDQWFFYYQDSLMTTLMKAPDLFAFMGILLGLLTLIFFSCLLYFSYKGLKHR